MIYLINYLHLLMSKKCSCPYYLKFDSTNLYSFIGYTKIEYFTKKVDIIGFILNLFMPSIIGTYFSRIRENKKYTNFNNVKIRN